jgi:L-iditol 2-dehydrogenase
MKAAIKTAEGTFEIKEVDQPPLPHDDWVRARVRYTGSAAPTCASGR